MWRWVPGVLLGLCACDPRPEPWDEPGSVAPLVAALDADQSGGLEPAEWLPRAYPGGDFARVDRDSDGRISTEEWLLELRQTDPMRFDGAHLRRVPSPDDPDPVHGGSWEARMVGELLRFLVAELRMACPDTVLPSEPVIRAAAAGASLAHPRVQALLVDLAQAQRACGLVLPSVLISAEERAARPGPAPDPAPGLSPSPGPAARPDAPAGGSGPG